MISACTIERDHSDEQFACNSGGPCAADARVQDATPTDRGFPDGGTTDARVDSGVDTGIDMGVTDGSSPDADPLAACLGILPLPNDGVVFDTTLGKMNNYEGDCFATGHEDTVYGFLSPGALTRLEMTTAGSGRDTALHFYRNECIPANRLACNDDDPDLWLESTIRMEALPPGVYAIVVDGVDGSGNFQLQVEGKTAPGEPCDPHKTFLACQIGDCLDTGGAYRCPVLLDCLDGFDNDGDGSIDEDASSCVDPPQIVTCEHSAIGQIGEEHDLIGAVSDPGSLVYRSWTVIDAPVGSRAEPFPPNANVALFAPDFGGTYTLRYTAVNTSYEAQSCEITLTPTITEGLRVELVWNVMTPPSENFANLDLHLLHYDGTVWFDPTHDCHRNECSQDWDAQGLAGNPDALRRSDAEVAWIREPMASTPSPGYGVGVNYYDDHNFGSSDVIVRIFCRGRLALDRITTLNNGFSPSLDHDFWKVADVVFNESGTDCAVTLIDTITTWGAAEQAR